MSVWRVILTDSESASGVASVCIGHTEEPHGVYDCCPHPHVECWSEHNAADIARMLTDTDAEVCS